MRTEHPGQTGKAYVTRRNGTLSSPSATGSTTCTLSGCAVAPFGIKRTCDRGRGIPHRIACFGVRAAVAKELAAPGTCRETPAIRPALGVDRRRRVCRPRGMRIGNWRWPLVPRSNRRDYGRHHFRTPRSSLGSCSLYRVGTCGRIIVIKIGRQVSLSGEHALVGFVAATIPEGVLAGCRARVFRATRSKGVDILLR